MNQPDANQSLNLYRLLAERAKRTAVRVGLMDAGKFRSLLLSQIPRKSGLVVTAVGKQISDHTHESCRNVGRYDLLADETMIFDSVFNLNEIRHYRMGPTLDWSF